MKNARRPHDIVVIGGSAGAVHASSRLLGLLPADFGAAVVLVIHLSPFFESRLPEVLGYRSALPVRWVEDGAMLASGTVQVAPPDHHVTLEWPRLRLDRGPREHYTRPAIDRLFISAARTCASRVVGVLLSGSNDDGTRGLIHITAAGGVALVQHPDDARHPRMPQSGMQHDSPEVLFIDALARRLVALTSGRSGDVEAVPRGGPE